LIIVVVVEQKALKAPQLEEGLESVYADAMPLAGRAIRFPAVVYTSTPLVPLHVPRHETVR